VLIVFACLLAVLTVPLAGGRLLRLADLELRAAWTVGAAIAIQVLVISVFPAQAGSFGQPIHLATYGLAGWFLWANRHISGLWLVGGGALMNFAAIVANGGVMPASQSALDASGLAHDKGEAFANSAAVPDAKLAPLGDVFAVPEAWPLSNVFSLGDICIVLGLLVAMHAVCASRLVPTGNGQFLALARQRSFVRVWLAQAVSNFGDFAYSLAVAVTVVERGEGVGVLATVLIVQAVPAVLMGLLGGPLVDRFSRRRLMIGADVCRALAVGSLLLADTPSSAHILVVAASLGTFGALFQPACRRRCRTSSRVSSSWPRTRSSAGRSTSPFSSALSSAAIWPPRAASTPRSRSTPARSR
jgi:hypothetical protein